MIEDSNKRLKKFSLIALAIVLLGVFSYWLYNYLTTASITIKASSASDYVSITPVSNGVSVPGSTIYAKASLTKRVKYGDYVISVFNHSNHLDRYIVVNSSSQRTYALALVSYSVVPQPVFGGAVNSVSASSTQISFIDSLGRLGTINTNNSLSYPYGLYRLVAGSWINPSVGLVDDNNNSIYLVDGGKAKKLSLPFKQNGAERFSISNSGSIYISNGNRLYLGSVSNPALMPLYTASGNIIQISASDQGVILLVGNNNNSAEPQGSLVFISGNKVTKSNISATYAYVSPDKQLIAAKTSSGINIYSSTLDFLYAVPSSSSSTSFVWGNAGSLYYSRGGTLWQYSTDNEEAYQITQTPGQNEITGIFPSQNGNYVYLNIADQNSLNSGSPSNELYRVPLGNQAQNTELSALGIILPTTIAGYCELNYIYLNTATLTVTYPSTTNQQSCSRALESFLNEYNIPPSALSVNYTPLPAN